MIRLHLMQALYFRHLTDTSLSSYVLQDEIQQSCLCLDANIGVKRRGVTSSSLQGIAVNANAHCGLDAHDLRSPLVAARTGLGVALAATICVLG